MQAMKWGPALAAGCCSILKPAEWTTLTALQVGAWATEVGFPDGVVQMRTYVTFFAVKRMKGDEDAANRNGNLPVT